MLCRPKLTLSGSKCASASAAGASRSIAAATPSRRRLAARAIALRPLRWGEKRNLARFARLGEAFLTRELVKLCLDAEIDLPRDEDELAALAALGGLDHRS